MKTKIPSEIQTRNREEMICPDCFTEGLEAHPGYIEEYEGDAAILRATRCPNDECTYHFGEGVPVDVIDEQFIESGFVSSLTSSLDVSTVLMGLLVMGGFLFLLTNVLGVGLPGLGGGVDMTVNGAVSTADGTPLPEATVELMNGSTSTTTNADGEYQLANLSAGTHYVSVEPAEDGLAASTVVLTITQDGTATANASNKATLDGTQLDIGVKDSVQVSASGSVANGSFLLNYSNPANAKKGSGVVVELAPPPGDVIAENTSVQTGSPRVMDIPGVMTSQSLQIETGVAEKEVSRSSTWNGTQASLALQGNLPVNTLQVDVSPDSNVHSRQVESEVQDGTTFSETVNGNIDGDMQVTLWGGSATAATTSSGTYTGSNPTVEIEDDAAPAQVTVNVTGSQRTTQESTTGAISGGAAEFTLDGTLPTRNTAIEFTGGTPENAQVGETTASADASSGTDSQQPVLFEADSTGSYRVDYDFTEERHGDLVTAGYKVNGALTEVSAGSDQTTLDLASGDTVRMYIQAEQETNAQEKTYERGGHDVYVTNTEVSTTSVDPGDPVQVTATLENRGSSYGLDVYLFTDGSEADSNNEYFGGGETKEVTFETRFAEEGTHTVSVNEGEQISIQVGAGDARSGAGSISGTASKTGADGTVNVDTNDDGTPDCSVDANGGSCDLGSLSPGDQSIVVSQEGVSGTGFKTTYDARFGAKDVSVDIDSDGVPELNKDGELADGESLTGSASVGSGVNPILFEVGNGGELPYEITYTEAGQVTKPKMYLDGKLVIDETENFKGERSYTVSDVEAGTHEFQFGSSNTSNTFNARIEWTESGDALYPALRLDGQTVCRAGQFADDNSCTIASPGDGGETVSLQFAGGADSFEYDTTYMARATPERVTVSANSGSQEYLKDGLSSQNADGSWITESNTDLLQSGTNRLGIRTATIDGLEPPVTATYSYTYQAKKPMSPTVVVVNAQNETFTKNVSAEKLNSDGILQEKSRLSLPAEWFTRGENEIQIRATNGGVVVTDVTATAEHEGVLQLAPAEESE